MAVTPHGFLPRDSHEIPPHRGGGTQVADFTRGFSRGNFTKILRRRNRGGQEDPDPLMVSGHHPCRSAPFYVFFVGFAIKLGISSGKLHSSDQPYVALRHAHVWATEHREQRSRC